jgi:signal transduction histidine kinase
MSAAECGATPALSALRFGVFVGVLVLFWVACLLITVPWVAVGIAVAGVGIDAAFEVLAGASRRRIAVSLAASAAVWLVAAATSPVAMEFITLSAMGQSWLVPAFGLSLVAGVALVAVLPAAHARAMWLLVSLFVSAMLFAASPALAPQTLTEVFALAFAPVPALDWPSFAVALLLSGAAVGALGYYLRAAVRRRATALQLAARLLVLAAVVGVSVGLALVATGRVAQAVASWQTIQAEGERIAYARQVARSLSAEFTASDIASATPALRRALAADARLGSVGLAIYDRLQQHVVLAIRRAEVGASQLTSEVPEIEQAGQGRVIAYAVVTLPPGDAAAIASAAQTDSPDAAEPGALPPRAVDLGFRDGSLPLVRDSLDTTSYSVAGAPPYDTRFKLVVSSPDNAPAENPVAASGELVGQLTPWLLLAFALAAALGLLAIDRRDDALAKLSASEERARLDRDAHDRVYNRLTALANKLAAGDGAEAAGEIRQTVHDLQALLGEAEPAQLLGAPDAAAGLLHDIASDQSRRWGMAVEVEAAGVLGGLDPRVAWDLVCIAEEALTNAGEHGRAVHARVRLRSEGATVALEVSDDGIGIAEQPTEGAGLRGMAERVRTLGGELAIERAESGGTVVRVSGVRREA